jgi:hypothetical protein
LCVSRPPAGRARLLTWVTDRLDSVLTHGSAEVVIEATGDPSAGIRHALATIGAGCHMGSASARVLRRRDARWNGPGCSRLRASRAQEDALTSNCRNSATPLTAVS